MWKITSILLSALMVATAFPLNAFADGSGNDSDFDQPIKALQETNGTSEDITIAFPNAEGDIGNDGYHYEQALSNFTYSSNDEFPLYVIGDYGTVEVKDESTGEINTYTAESTNGVPCKLSRNKKYTITAKPDKSINGAISELAAYSKMGNTGKATLLGGNNLNVNNLQKDDTSMTVQSDSSDQNKVGIAIAMFDKGDGSLLAGQLKSAKDAAFEAHSDHTSFTDMKVGQSWQAKGMIKTVVGHGTTALNVLNITSENDDIADIMNNVANGNTGTSVNCFQPNHRNPVTGPNYYFTITYDRDGTRNGKPVKVFSWHLDYVKESDGTWRAIRDVDGKTGPQLDPNIAGDKTGVQLLNSEFYVSNDTPMYTTDFQIEKKSSNDSASASLEDAEFKVEYFTSEDGSGDPHRTWAIKTIKSGDKYIAKLDDEHKISGDAFYIDTATQKPAIPRGSIRVTEVKAPDGYKNDGAFALADGTSIDAKDGTIVLPVKSDGDTVNVMYGSANANSITATDTPSTDGSITVEKVDNETKKNEAQGDGSLAATMKIVNCDSKPLFIHDKEYQTGEGYMFTLNNDGKATVDGIANGKYELVEEKAPNGYKIDGTTSKTFAITDENKTVSFTGDNAISDAPIRGGFAFRKFDADTGSDVKGGLNLKAKFAVYNKSAHDVVVNGDTYKPNAEITSAAFETNGKGYYESAKNLLPYGKYGVRETEAPAGYELNNNEVTFEISTDNSIVPAGTFTNGQASGSAVADKAKLYSLELTKAKLVNGEDKAVDPESGASFTFVLANKVEEISGKTVDIITRQDVIDAIAKGTFGDHELISAKTDENGKAKFENMLQSEYLGVMTGGNENYTIYPNVIKFNAGQTDANKITIYDEAKSYRIQLRKVDAETGESVTYTPAVYTLKKIADENGNEFNVGKYTADQLKNRNLNQNGEVTFYTDGKAYSKFATVKANGVGENDVYYPNEDTDGSLVLPVSVDAGTYKLTEVTAPEGYTKSANSSTGNIEENNIVITFSSPLAADKDGNKIFEIVNYDDQKTGSLYVTKKIENRKGIDTSLINKDQEYGFTLYAKKDIKSPATGKTIVPKGAEAMHYVQSGDKYELTRIGELKCKDGESAAFDSLPLGEYTLKETTDGCNTRPEKESYDVVIAETEKGEVTTTVDGHTNSATVGFTVKDMVTETDISKTDITGDKELPGAKLQVIDAETNVVVDEWTSTNIPHKIDGLAYDHDYILKENTAPAGYTKASEITFHVNGDTKKVTKVKMVDLAAPMVTVTKQDNCGKPVSGAKLALYQVNADGTETLVDAWTTGDKTHKITPNEGTAIEAGKTYVIREEETPAHYVKMKDYKFTVKDGEDVSIKLTDARYLVSKEDVGGKEIPGAVITVTDKETGKIVDKWTSGTEKHYIDNLEEGKTYTLSEDTAPLGYVKDTSVDFTVGTKDCEMVLVDTIERVKKVDTDGSFVDGAEMEIIDESGTVVDTWTTGQQIVNVSEENQEKLKNGEDVTFTGENGEEVTIRVTSKVEGKNSTGSTSREKTAEKTQDKLCEAFSSDTAVKGEDLFGDKPAKGEYDYTAVITTGNPDGSATTKYADVDVTGKETYHRVSGLESGHTYTVREVKAPDGYTIDADHPINTDSMANHVTAVTDTHVTVSKEDIGGKEVPGAKLKVVDKNTGNTVDEWISTDTLHNVQGLEAGRTYVLEEDTAPLGYVKATNVEFTVNNKGINQKVKMVDTISKLAKVDENGNIITGAVLEAKDKDGNVVDTWTSGQHIIDLTADEQNQLKAGKAVEKTQTDGTNAKVYVLGKDSKDTAYQAVLTKPDGAVSNAMIDLDGNETYHMIGGMTAGEDYTISEVTPKDGYYFAKDTVIHTEADKDTDAEMTDYMTKYFIRKVDENGNSVAGVTLKLFDITDSANEAEIELPNGGVTTDKPFELDGKLSAGHTYRLDETEIVGGYYRAQSMEFKVERVGKSPDGITITMVDSTADVSVKKVDEAGKPLAGATMQVIDKDTGTVVHEYKTTADAAGEDISSYVKGGSTYILHEAEAPFGYNLADDQEFTVTGTSDKPQVIEAVDTAGTVKIRVTKVDNTDKSKHLEGAKFVLNDANGKPIQSADGKDIKGVTGTDGTVTFILKYRPSMENESYKIHETEAPKGYHVNTADSDVKLDKNYTFKDSDCIEITVEDTPIRPSANTGVKGITGFATFGCIAMAALMLMLRSKQKYLGFSK